ncbi:hypothetical protein PV646_34085 [Streptomyces sp. ID05-26A]|nr:hypothetical protein [Streptomyces sp. ID05-26A]
MRSIIPNARRVRRTGQPTTLAASMPRPVVQTATRGPLGDVELRTLGGAK